MTLGFTGTRDGMTQTQYITVTMLLRELLPTDIHHGDCVGADEQLNTIALNLGIRTHAHPGNQAAHTASTRSSMRATPRPNLLRNIDIVEAGLGGLIATPRATIEAVRSGTWHTVRHARRMKRHIWIVWPDGRVRHEVP